MMEPQIGANRPAGSGDAPALAEIEIVCSIYRAMGWLIVNKAVWRH
jgi:hypothetical protein